MVAKMAKSLDRLSNGRLILCLGGGSADDEYRAFAAASTEAADLEPKPQRPIPIWLGTFAPRAWALTSRLADGWIPSLSHATANRGGS
jgi:alkanesulfonate monooxygenase SsuD/methylene tetrahydromethanopterin reductase-like flavin-dependent oxidoreductase (luciferase family)